MIMLGVTYFSKIFHFPVDIILGFLFSVMKNQLCIIAWIVHEKIFDPKAQSSQLTLSIFSANSSFRGQCS